MLGTLAFQYAALRAPAFGVPGASANLFRNTSTNARLSLTPHSAHYCVLKTDFILTPKNFCQ